MNLSREKTGRPPRLGTKSPFRAGPFGRALFAFGLAAGLAASAAGAAERWVSIGPAGGVVRQLAQSTSDPLRLYAATEPTGLVRSRNGGRSWESIQRGLEGQEIRQLAVDPRNREIVLASSSGATGPQIWRSTTGGLSWAAATKPPLDDGVAVFATFFLFDTFTPGGVIAATPKGIFRSLDGGATWDLRALPDVSVVALARDPETPRIFYAAGREPGFQRIVIYRSDDRGLSWYWATSVGTPAADVLPDRLFLREGALYAAWAGALYRLNDGAGSWSLDARLPTLSALDFSFAPSGRLYAATEAGVYSSNDGTKWSPPESPSAALAAPPDGIVRLAFLPGGEVIAAGHRGIWRSTDAGDTWQTANRGLGARTVRSLVALSNPRGSVIAGFDEGIFRTDRTSGGWLRLPTQNGFELPALAADPHHPGRVYALGEGGAVGVSENLGTRWRRLGEVHIDSVGLFRVDPVRDGILYASGASNGSSGSEFTFQSLDGGATWTEILDVEMLDLDFDRAHPKVGFRILSNGHLDKTTNGGAGWATLPGLSGQLLGARPRSLLFDPRSRALYVGTDRRGVFRSTDGGRTFSRLAAGLPAGEAPGRNALVARLILDAGGTSIYAAMAERGVYRLDAGRRWAAVNLGLPAGEFFGNLVADPGRAGRLYAGTGASGVWRLDND